MTSVLSTSALAENKLAFLGTGSMNGAVLRGIIAAGYDPRAIVATLRSDAKAHDLRTETGVTVLVGEQDPEANL